MHVILTSNQDPEDERKYWSLTVGLQYEVIGISADNYRILDDTGDPVIFNQLCFEIMDPSEPDFWEVSFGDGGERYANPPEWHKPGFFEDFHDHVGPVRQQFWKDHRKYYGEPRSPTKSRDAWRHM
ncbi:MAG: hypothetical protein DHS20C16_29450 [Phycisphaerae bacterium]|nr:MAG: hypothetical protein DHS20C16_29450 [Phycisphaerae bacterium]